MKSEIVISFCLFFLTIVRELMKKQKKIEAEDGEADNGFNFFLYFGLFLNNFASSSLIFNELDRTYFLCSRFHLLGTFQYEKKKWKKKKRRKRTIETDD